MRRNQSATEHSPLPLTVSGCGSGLSAQGLLMGTSTEATGKAAAANCLNKGWSATFWLQVGIALPEPGKGS